jgi:hypothetical protein
MIPAGSEGLHAQISKKSLQQFAAGPEMVERDADDPSLPMDDAEVQRNPLIPYYQHGGKSCASGLQLACELFVRQPKLGPVL